MVSISLGPCWSDSRLPFSKTLTSSLSNFQVSMKTREKAEVETRFCASRLLGLRLRMGVRKTESSGRRQCIRGVWTACGKKRLRDSGQVPHWEWNSGNWAVCPATPLVRSVVSSCENIRGRCHYAAESALARHRSHRAARAGIRRDGPLIDPGHSVER